MFVRFLFRYELGIATWRRYLDESSLHWERVADILYRHAVGHIVFAFGSRATGQRLEQYSDPDLAFSVRLSPIDHAILVDPAFRARIEPDLVPLIPIFA